MIVLMWIYVFQFEDILDKWQNATGMTDSQYVTILLIAVQFNLFILYPYDGHVMLSPHFKLFEVISTY